MPASVSISPRATRFARPKPPPTRSANAATVKSPLEFNSGSSSPERSASQSSNAPGGAARSAADKAWPLPRRGRRRTTAPASSATSAVRSREPSSATMTSASGNALRRRATVVPITASSSRAGTRMVSGSSTRRRRQRSNGRQQTLRSLLRSVAAGQRGIGEQGDECELPHRRLDVVDGREACPLERLDGAGHIARTLHTDCRNADVGETRVKTLEKESCWPGLRRHRANEHDAVRRRFPRTDLLLDEHVLQCTPQRGVRPRNELLPKVVAEVLELIRPGVACEQRLVRQLRGQNLRVDWNLDEPDSQRRAGTCVSKRRHNRGTANLLRRTDEEHGDLLPLQPVRQHALVSALHEGMISGCAVHERLDLGSEHFGLALGASQVLLEPLSFCVAEPV